MSILSDVCAKMNHGEHITDEERNMAVDCLSGKYDEAVKRGLVRWQESLMDLAERIAGYKAPTKRELQAIQNPKARSLSVISSDIEKATSLIREYERCRRFDKAARWAFNREEFEKEFSAAQRGDIYKPQIKDSEMLGNHVSQGIQVSAW